MRNESSQDSVPIITSVADNVSNLHGVYAIDEIMVDILSRLPPKSLMRFKCVRKSWLSLIQEDKHFFLLYSCRSKSNKKMVIQSYRGGISFLTLDLLKQSIEDVTTIPRTCDGKHMHGPINGLLCFVDGKGSVLIYNLCTKEASPWITSNVWKNNNGRLLVPISGFGFDPVTQEHKVLLVWLIDGTFQKVAVDVLTVGENTWRTSYQVLPVNDFGYRTAIYINGFIYWFIVNLAWEGDQRLYNILAFDVGKENFRLIKPPPNGIRYRDDYEFPLEVDGQLAIMERMDNDDQKKVTEMRVWTCINQEEVGKNNYKWIWEMIELPFCMEDGKIYVIKSIPGTDLFMITRIFRSEESLIYFYDMKKKKFCEYGSLPQPENKYENYFHLSVLEESIYPVGAQLPVGDHHDQMITTSPPQPLVDTEEWSNTSIVIGVCCFLGMCSALYVFRK